MSDAEILFEQTGSVGLITLNRPKALNALTLGMIRALAATLMQWEKEDTISCVVIKGAGGKAFCAGGDVRAVYEAGLAAKNNTQPASLTCDFFAEEYRLNAQVKVFSKPYIALMDGIVMGGGAGVSVHGSHRIVTERTSFAMPECTIGFFPDIGAGYFLNQAPGFLGRYLALTGARIEAGDCLYARLATHALPSEKIDSFLGDLCTNDFHIDHLNSLLGTYATISVQAPLQTEQKRIDDIFALNTVEKIIAELQKDGSDWSKNILKSLQNQCPLSLKITLRQLTECRLLDLPAVLDLEYKLSQSFMKGSTFYEGIRAQLVDKDRNPHWQPPTLGDVSSEMVDSFFL